MPTSRFVYWNDRSHKKGRNSRTAYRLSYGWSSRASWGDIFSRSPRLLPSPPPPVFLCLFVIFDSRSFPHHHPLPWFLLRTLYTLLLSHTVHQENASPLGARIVVPPNLYLVFRCPRHLTRALEDQVRPLPAV